MEWIVKKPSALKVAAYKNRLGINPIMAKVLLNRGISIDTADKELNSPADLVEDPSKIAGAEEAVDAILAQCGKEKHFFIFADYDVDGLTSGYIMTDFLTSIGEKAYVYYPERKEGYGLNTDFVRSVGKDTVVITVDNGVTKVEEVAILNEHNVPVIVTDHHEPQEHLPNCPICNPWLKEDSAGRHLCGAAVAWKVCMLLEDKLGVGDIEKYLPHVAIATIADVMPMTTENIALVNLGVAAANAGSSKAIKLLMDMLEIKELTPEDIAWKIAPKLNACGRMGNVSAGGDLFFMEDESDVDIKDQIRDIIELDDERVKYTKTAQKEIAALNFSQDNICLFDATSYPIGIAGIIAGKLAEHFGKPAFVYNTLGRDVYSTSARSVPGLDLPKLLNTELEKETIVSWGGHAQACGVALRADSIREFKASMNQQIADLISSGTIKVVEPKLDIDAEIQIADLNTKVLKELERLPYDKEVCPEPTFCLCNVKVKAKQPYSNKDHLVLECEDDGGHKITLVSWNEYSMYKEIGEPEVVDIAGKICTVGFLDRTTKRKPTDVTIRIKDIKASA